MCVILVGGSAEPGGCVTSVGEAWPTPVPGTRHDVPANDPKKITDQSGVRYMQTIK